MNRNDKLIDLLNKIHKILISANELEWSRSFKEFLTRCNDSNMELINDILRIFGGMGSFSDLVLYSDMKVLVSKNTELDKLRKRLFKILIDFKANS